MSDRMGFVWYELLTDDLAAALTFYRRVHGWTVRDSGQPGMEYRLLAANGVDIGGAMAIPPGGAEAGMRPAWLGYVGVADVDASLARIETSGGTTTMPATTIAGVGRVAMFADPQGALLYLIAPMRPPGSEGQSRAFEEGTPGHVGWNDLRTSDAPKALEFYGDLFGWAEDRGMDMGPMGTYHIFRSGPSTGGMDGIGGMMTDRSGARPMWRYYVNVDDIDAAAGRAAEAGGTILFGPVQVPSGSWTVDARDPQGAAFCMVGPRKS